MVVVEALTSHRFDDGACNANAAGGILVAAFHLPRELLCLPDTLGRTHVHNHVLYRFAREDYVATGAFDLATYLDRNGAVAFTERPVWTPKPSTARQWRAAAVAESNAGLAPVAHGCGEQA